MNGRSGSLPWSDPILTPQVNASILVEDMDKETGDSHHLGKI